MADFRCWNEDCIHNDNSNHCTCNALIINIGDDYPYGCAEYLAYTNTAEYQKPYYKACKEHITGETVKVLCYGKKIMIKDEVFYTEIKDIERNTDCCVTHGRTGYCGEYQRLIDRWAMICQTIKKLPSVTSYPDGLIYEGKCYKKEGCNGKDDI